MKGVSRIRNSKKDRHNNGQMKKYKTTNNDLQTLHSKTKDRARRTTLKTWDEPVTDQEYQYSINITYNLHGIYVTNCE
jgi:hypothetical protein